MSDKATSLAVYALNNLGPRDAIAVQVVASREGVSAREIGEACGRGKSWFGSRLENINDVLGEIELEIGVRPGSQGYEVRDLVVAEPAPEQVATHTEPSTAAQPATPPAPPKIHAHYATFNGRIFDIRRMLAASPEETRQRVSVTMQGGGYVHIPAPGNNGEARALADKIIALKKSEDGVKVTDLSEGASS